MRTFLSVALGTHEPSKFLEMHGLRLYATSTHISFGFPSYRDSGPLPKSHYNGSKQSNAHSLAFVGKGTTFDSGGVTFEPCTVQPPFFTCLPSKLVLKLGETGN